ncbi:MAG: 50S ribosomal protein L29 [Candidatus Buchananbacteria bacterium]
MDIKEIKLKPETELQHLLSETRKKLDDLSFKAKQDQLKTVRDIRVVKKDIAKILTVLKQK